MIAAAGLDSASVLIAFGLMQILTGLRYGLPMPVQPLKAVAVIVITQGIAGGVLRGGGLAIGLVMLVLTLTGGIDVLARWIPRAVVRGIQFGLAIQLSTLALGDYVRRDGAPGWALAAVATGMILLLRGSRRMPPALPVIALGAVYALLFDLPGAVIPDATVSLRLPILDAPSLEQVLTGALLLALPQIPLSLGNSLLATQQVVRDLFPDRAVGIRRLGVTYGAMNLITPFLGGVPVCHGSGGIAGHHAFGARSGGSVVIYGGMFLLAGLLFSPVFELLVRIFPMPILGTILLFEAIAILMLVRDAAASAEDWFVTLLTGLIAAGIPYGYPVAMVVGTAVAWGARQRNRLPGRTD